MRKKEAREVKPVYHPQCKSLLFALADSLHAEAFQGN